MERRLYFVQHVLEKKAMFEFLASEVNKKANLSESDLLPFHQRDDETTILHISILYKQDRDGMTGLQLLSCDNSAFRRRTKGNYPKELFYYCMTLKLFHVFQLRILLWKLCAQSTLWGDIRAEKQRYESAVQLAEFLIGKDTSWEATKSTKGESNPKTHKYASSSTVLQHQDHVGSREKSPTDALPFGNPQKSQDTNEKVEGTPLILATEHGCTEIVEAILNKYPQAVEHVDGEGRNILHLAIEHRHKQIFDKVEGMGFPVMIKLIRKLDNNGNTILHNVGKKKDAQGAEDMRSPALLLRDDLLLYERVRKVTATQFVKHFNRDGKTVEQHTFAHVCPDICDNVSFDPHITLSSLPQKLMLGLTFLIFSVSTMMLAFAAMVILLIRNKERWTKITLYSVAFFPVTIFALSYMPLYKSLIKTLKYSLKNIWARSESVLPHRPWTFKQFNVCKSHARDASSSTHPSTPQTTRYPV
ncbi:hypothetical protein RJ639_003083 [Escallonia herrerae]|uniref:PGG domain-containing protein n=1 Tax=Escallonia herrerae TaxID=1293975 RepID=A0AA88VZ68_9ASTE|nr:hypothetical protein RJ639_003083 [Escallonia herrerae]